MSVFADTSAFLALLDGDEAHHAAAGTAWADLLQRDEPIVTTSYVLVETYALVERRLGLDAVRGFTADFVPLLEVVWVDAALHAMGVGALLAARRRALSLVDCVSFEAMRQRHIVSAFAVDPDFGTQGFEVVPAGRR
jgi:predicted nucleic acid-binding protein